MNYYCRGLKHTTLDTLRYDSPTKRYTRLFFLENIIRKIKAEKFLHPSPNSR